MVDAAVQPSEVAATDDGIPLKVKLARATRRQKMRALMLVAPLGLFVVITFVWPIVEMLTRSVWSPELGQILQRTTVAVEQWDGEGIPDEAVFAEFALDVKGSRDRQDHRQGGHEVQFRDFRHAKPVLQDWSQA